MSDVFSYSIISTAIVLSLMGLVFAIVMPGIDRWSRHFFRTYFFIFFLGGITSIADLLLLGHPAPMTAVYIVTILECLFISLPRPC